MKKFSSISAALVFVFTFVFPVHVAEANKVPLATIMGSVRDSSGKPLANAVSSLIKDGTTKVSKTIRTAADGSFTAKIIPGRYGIHAIAEGFTEVVFDAVEVRASQELIYKFNLEPAGSGRTLPERRRDRDDVKWRLRAAQNQRSIFQAQEGADATIAAVVAAEDAANHQTIAETTETTPVPASESEKSTRPQG